MAKYKVLLVCAGGLSSSLLESVTAKAASKRGHELDIHAASAALVVYNSIDFAAYPVDMVLIAPQVRFARRSIERVVEPLGIVVDVIDPTAYGMVDGDKLFDQIVQVVPK